MVEAVMDNSVRDVILDIASELVRECRDADAEKDIDAAEVINNKKIFIFVDNDMEVDPEFKPCLVYIKETGFVAFIFFHDAFDMYCQDKNDIYMASTQGKIACELFPYIREQKIWGK